MVTALYQGFEGHYDEQIQGDGFQHLNPWEKKERIWASKEFSWKLLNCKHPGEMPYTSDSGIRLLWRMIRACCPGYNELCGRKWNAEHLLSDAGYNADVAFLSALDSLQCCDGGE